MAFTTEELVNIANASMDYYFRDGRTPLERVNAEIKECRYLLRVAQRELDSALARRKQVHKMPYAERHKRAPKATSFKAWKPDA